MNAYELADIVDKWAYSESAEYLTDAANMLRQQADRIERKQELIREQTALLVKQNNRIAELEKEKIRAYDNGYEDGRKHNTQLNTQLHPQIKESEYVKNVKKAAEVGEQG